MNSVHENFILQLFQIPTRAQDFTTAFSEEFDHGFVVYG